mgnify:CR=1 FL=1
MEGYQSFRPRGDTFLVLGSTPASGYVTRAGGPASGEVVYMVYNSGAGNAYLAYGMTSAAALANAAIPIDGTPRPVLPCPNGSIQAFTLAPMLFFCAVVPSGNAPLMITPGEGV